MRPPLHTHCTLARLLDADPLDCLSQIIARAHLRVQEHLAQRRGQRGTRVRSAPGSVGRAQSARAWSRPLCVLAGSARRRPARKSHYCMHFVVAHV